MRFSTYSGLNPYSFLGLSSRIIPKGVMMRGITFMLIAATAGKELALHDLLGRRVEAPITWEGGEVQLDLSSLAAGVYYISISTGNGIAVRQVSVEP